MLVGRSKLLLCWRQNREGIPMFIRWNGLLLMKWNEGMGRKELFKLQVTSLDGIPDLDLHTHSLRSHDVILISPHPLCSLLPILWHHLSFCRFFFHLFSRLFVYAICLSVYFSTWLPIQTSVLIFIDSFFFFASCRIRTNRRHSFSLSRELNQASISSKLASRK